MLGTAPLMNSWIAFMIQADMCPEYTDPSFRLLMGGGRTQSRCMTSSALGMSQHWVTGFPVLGGLRL